ncbi:MAG: porphobilinogen synthase [Parachlamydiaceae bacterium]|nr:porphobilinogen synthase [Parachlamydiaceae bacterium]
MTFQMTTRLRRLRQHPTLRTLVRETELNLQDLVLPLFIKGKEGSKKPIASMPGHYQIPINLLEKEIEEVVALGITSVLLFGIPAHKDACGSDSYSDEGIVQTAIRQIRKSHPNLLIISDVCFCEYTDHGHCGVITERAGKMDVHNDKTLDLLVKQAVSHARAGADVVAPSGMMDGMVRAIRGGLDAAGFCNIPILSYSVKYNSCMYGPFRQAAEGAPSFGDRSSHQMDPANALEALREVQLDVDEGADMLMVKPAHSYLDVIYRVKQAHPYVPLGAYHTSGEFCMIKAAAEKGWVDEKKAALEILNGIKRAGADFIITYFAKDFARW